MEVDRVAETRQRKDLITPRQHFSLTPNELMQLGLFRVGYVTEVSGPGRSTQLIVHGANGMPIATVDSVEHAINVAEHLGLSLVPVH